MLLLVVNLISLCLYMMFKLQTWIGIVDGDLQDCTRSDLYSYIVDFLCSCSSLDLVWKYAHWVLQKDPTVGSESLSSIQHLTLLDQCNNPFVVCRLVSTFSPRDLKVETGQTWAPTMSSPTSESTAERCSSTWNIWCWKKKYRYKWICVLA